VRLGWQNEVKIWWMCRKYYTFRVAAMRSFLARSCNTGLDWNRFPSESFFEDCSFFDKGSFLPSSLFWELENTLWTNRSKRCSLS
jgi:hypothetical protein